MQTRRTYIEAISSITSTLLAGCSGTDESSSGTSRDGGNGNGDSNDTPADEGTPTARSIGESVTYGGLEMAVTETQTAGQITTADGSDIGEERDKITPEQGAVFALAYIRIENVGDTEVFYPERGGDIQMVYKGEETSDEFVTGPLGINGEMEPVYSDSMEEEGADTGAFPGTVVEGWAVFELPEGFTLGDAFITIRYSDTSTDSRTFRWQFGEN